MGKNGIRIVAMIAIGALLILSAATVIGILAG